MIASCSLDVINNSELFLTINLHNTLCSDQSERRCYTHSQSNTNRKPIVTSPAFPSVSCLVSFVLRQPVKNRSYLDSAVFSFFREVYDVLVKDGTIVPKAEKSPPTVPMDYSWAQVSKK